MYRPIILAVYIATAFAQSPAAIIRDNVPGTGFVAVLDAGSGPITGSVEIVAATDGTGVKVALNLNGFNTTDSEDYTYHIHQSPVPPTGNCNDTKAHFDNRGVSDDFVCDPQQSELCQLGDLSGKHGAISLKNGINAISLQYIDEFLSTSADNSAFFGNLSIVVHKKSNKLRLKCGNFVPLSEHSSSTNTPSGDTTFPNATTSTQVVTTSIEGVQTNQGTSTQFVNVTGYSTQTISSKTATYSSEPTGVLQSNESTTVYRDGKWLITIISALFVTMCFV